MTGTEAAWLPWAGAALGGLGGYLGGARPEQAQITGYGEKYPSLHPEELFRGATGDLGRLAALYAQRAQTPVSMPSSYVQPLPMFKGSIVDAFGLGMDPALPRPELQTRSGVNFGSKEALPFYQGGGTDVGSQVARGGREVYKSSEQPASPFPTFGGAHSELGDMQKALAMLRPSGPPSFDFSGARGATTTPTTTDTTTTIRVDDTDYVPQPGDYVDKDGVVHRYDPTKHQRPVDYTVYGTPHPDFVPDPNNPDPYQGSVTDSSGQPVPIDPSTGGGMGRPFPGGEYSPIPGGADQDNPGSSFMPTDALWGQQDLTHPFRRSSTGTSVSGGGLANKDLELTGATNLLPIDPITGQPRLPPEPRLPEVGDTLPPETRPWNQSSSGFMGPQETGPFDPRIESRPKRRSPDTGPLAGIPDPWGPNPYYDPYGPPISTVTRRTLPTNKLPAGPYKSIG